MVVKVVSVICALIVAATLSGCQTIDQIDEQGRKAKACVAAGGEWYNAGSLFGPECYFDTRDNK